MGRRLLNTCLIIALLFSLLPLQVHAETSESDDRFPMGENNGVNLLENGGFEETESAPTEQNGPEGTHWDVGLWTDNIKAKSWVFQKYNMNANSSMFNAEIDYTHVYEGEQSVKITVNQTTGSNVKGFLKQMSVSVKGGSYYQLSSAFFAEVGSYTGNLEVWIEYTNLTNSKTTINLGSATGSWSVNETVFKAPNNATTAQIVFRVDGGAKGTFWLDEVSLIELNTDITEISLSHETVSIQKDSHFLIEAQLSPAYANVENLEWVSLDTTIATVKNGEIKGLTAGTTTIIARSKTNEDIKATVAVNIYEGDLEVQSISLGNSVITLDIGRSHYLKYQITPNDISINAKEITWSSSDDSIISVDHQGMITAKRVGTVTIRASINDQHSAEVTVNSSESESNPDYLLMESRWVEKLVGSDTLDLSNPYIASYVKKINDDAKAHYESMDISSDRVKLWEETETTKVANMTTTFTKLKTIALAYGQKSSVYYQDREVYETLIEAIDFAMNYYEYGDLKNSGGNWWDWQIGTTQPLLDTLMILRPALPQEKIEKYGNIISYYVNDPREQYPNSTATGANLTDIGIGVLGVGILLEGDDKLELVQKYVPTVFKLVTTGDGLYEDGGIIQHKYYAYIGSYGNELMKGVGKVLSIVADTQWEFEAKDLQNVFDTIDKGVLNIVHQGQLMASMQGRSMSRAPGSNKYSTAFMGGNEISANILSLADVAPEELQTKIYNYVKLWIESSDPHYYYLDHPRDFEHIVNLVKALDKGDSSQIARGMKIFGSMDRVINNTPRYTATVSMYSERIANFEYINTENGKGWHTGDGMFYLYNNDQRQFGEGYWATVDSYRLVGTTIDTRPLSKGAGYGVVSTQTMVGGVSNGTNGSAVMVLDKSNFSHADMKDMNLKAKKSYFFMDDKIVFLGSGINGTSSYDIQTVIENRMIDDVDSFYLNGQVVGKEMLTKDLLKGSWAYFDTKKTDTSIGYVVLDDVRLTYGIESNSGKYSEINGTFPSDTLYHQDYVKLLIEHGNSVENGTYAYVMLPGATQEQTQEFTQENSLVVLENTSKIQAVLDEEHEILVFNVFEPTSLDLSNTSFPATSIDINTPGSYIIEVRDDTLHITVSNPTQDNSTLSMVVHGAFKNLETVEGFTTNLTDDKLEVSFDSSNAIGASSTITVDLVVDTQALENTLEEAYKIDLGPYTPQSSKLLLDAIENANALLNSGNFTRSEINALLVQLNEFIEGLVRMGEKEGLEAIMAKAQALSNLTAYSQGIIDALLLEAKTVLQDENASQSDVDSVASKLEIAMLNIETNLDLSKAMEILAEVEALDLSATNESVETLKAAVNKLKEIVSQYDPSKPLRITQQIIDDAVIDVVSALNQLDLSESVDTSVLETLLEAIEDLNEKDYTSDSWNALMKVVRSAKDLLLENPSQEAVNQMIASLQAQLKALSEVSTTDQDLPVTGLHTNNMSMLLVLMGLVLLSSSLFMKKRRTT